LCNIVLSCTISKSPLIFLHSREAILLEIRGVDLPDQESAVASEPVRA